VGRAICFTFYSYRTLAAEGIPVPKPIRLTKGSVP
jgi:hypothetical protein